MLSQKLSTAELMITAVKLKSITAESAAGVDRLVGCDIINRCGRASESQVWFQRVDVD